MNSILAYTVSIFFFLVALVVASFALSPERREAMDANKWLTIVTGSCLLGWIFAELGAG